MIHLSEHSKDLAVIQRDWFLEITFSDSGECLQSCYARRFDIYRHNKVLLSVVLWRKWGKIGNAELLKFLERQGSNIDRMVYDGNILSIHFFRCIGANNLYMKMLRRSAEKQKPKASVATHSAMVDQLHMLFKHLHNGGNETKKLKPSEFHTYFLNCQVACVASFGASGMDEDDGEFDHGFEPVNPK